MWIVVITFRTVLIFELRVEVLTLGTDDSDFGRLYFGWLLVLAVRVLLVRWLLLLAIGVLLILVIALVLQVLWLLILLVLDSLLLLNFNRWKSLIASFTVLLLWVIFNSATISAFPGLRSFLRLLTVTLVLGWRD